MSMFTKFLEWQSHLEETDSLKKKSQLSSVAKTLEWGLKNASGITQEDISVVEQTITKILSLTSLDNKGVLEASSAYNIVKLRLSETTDNDAKINNATVASKVLTESAGESGKLLVIDFEMVCDDTKDVDGEIIEFGACVFDINKNQIIATLSLLTKPKKVDVLPDFCVKLTGITNEEMHKLGHEFIDAAKELESLIIEHKLEAVCQWGCGDMKRLKLDYTNNSIDCSLINKLKVIDLKKPFADSFGCKPRIGLKKAIAIAGIKRDSAVHRALPDAIETTKLVSVVISRG